MTCHMAQDLDHSSEFLACMACSVLCVIPAGQMMLTHENVQRTLIYLNIDSV